jgi:DNA-binding NarL/FixJ family response regulator
MTALAAKPKMEPVSKITRRGPCVFRNSYTRDGQRFWTGVWSVKLQHQGQRRTLALRAKTKSSANVEARAIGDTLRREGWEAVLRNYPNPRKSEDSVSKMDADYWRERLMVRRYPFPACVGSESDLAARIDHAGTGYWFPLGTTHVESAAEQARKIYETAVKHGWETCCGQFSHELIIGFEWCSNPILWTYSTIHTLLHEKPVARPRGAELAGRCRVLIAEQDAGIRRALEWCINQHGQFESVACGSAEVFGKAFEIRRPSLVLLNRNLAERIGFNSPGQIAMMRDSVPAVAYSVALDGDQLFVSTPGGAGGYIIKRVKPDRILEPILDGGLGFSAGDLPTRVKNYFKSLLQPSSNGSASGIARLTRRESEVLALLSKGCVDKEIAQSLGISAWTVHGHIKSIFERLGVRTRTEAVVRYLEK